MGRVKTYEAIVKGDPMPQPGIPESFRVLMKELQSLGLNVVVQDKDGQEIDMHQSFDDDDAYGGMAVGEDVLVEDELNGEYSVKDADEGFDDLDEDMDKEPTAEDLFSMTDIDPLGDDF